MDKFSIKKQRNFWKFLERQQSKLKTFKHDTKCNLFQKFQNHKTCTYNCSSLKNNNKHFLTMNGQGKQKWQTAMSGSKDFVYKVNLMDTVDFFCICHG